MVLQDYNEVTQAGSKSFSNAKDRPHSGGPSGRRGTVIKTSSISSHFHAWVGSVSDKGRRIKSEFCDSLSWSACSNWSLLCTNTNWPKETCSYFQIYSQKDHTLLVPNGMFNLCQWGVLLVSILCGKICCSLVALNFLCTWTQTLIQPLASTIQTTTGMRKLIVAPVHSKKIENVFIECMV